MIEGSAIPDSDSTALNEARLDLEAGLRRLASLIWAAAFVSVLSLTAGFVRAYQLPAPDIYAESLFLLAVALLAAAAIPTMLRVEYIARLTPMVIGGASAMVISQFLHVLAKLPAVKEGKIPLLGEGTDFGFVRETLFYGGAMVLHFSCILLILEAARARVRLAGESQERARALSERADAERALRESEERYRQLVDASPIAIIVHVRGRMVFANKATARLIGAEGPAELLGREVMEFVCPEFQGVVAERMRRLFEAGVESEPHEIRILRLDGATLDVEVTAIPVAHHGEQASQVVMQDLTARRRAEAEKTRLEVQIRHAQKMEAIGTLAGGVAHDFNNLLAGILGYANMLKVGAAPGKIEKAAEVIERAASRASELTQQLLGFARKGKLQNVAVDPHATIREVIDLLSRTIDKNIKITERLHAAGAYVMGDPTQIQQVVLNLALNARDAMPNGGEMVFETDVVEIAEIDARSFADAAPGHYVMIGVADTGRGIAEENRERVFEPFFTTKEPGKGTGMGLAMVYGIVRNHGGAITLYSEEGRGTTMRVYLPLAEATDATPPAETARPVRGAGRILVVDDEEVVREMVTDMLVALGYEVLTACDGEEALAVYLENQESIDLAVIDMIMPKMGGRDCFRALRLINPDLKAVLSTGYGRDGAAQEILDEGMCGFAQKPYRMNQLSEIVSAALD